MKEGRTVEKREHTPGPWKIVETLGDQEIQPVDDKSVFVEFGALIVCKCGPQEHPENKANARLIAAAPDYHKGAELTMLSASPLFADDLSRGVVISEEAYDVLRAALAKARGEG